MKLNLGSGWDKKNGFVNIDIDPGAEPDVVCDILHMPFREGAADGVRAFDVLEHVPNDKRIAVIEEIYRVLKPDGLFEHFTPTTDGRGAFQDPTHLSFWNINSWFYYCPELIGGKKYYNIKAEFRVSHLKDYTTYDSVLHTHGVMNAVK